MSEGLPQIALERDGSNALLRRYTYGVQRISMTSGGNTSYYLRDGLGSTANLTSSSGATQWTWSYEPFGSIRTETKAGGNQPDNFMKFTGEYLDPTGLYHLRARQYDPSTGRFLRPDPVDAGVGSPAVAGYAYVAGRPTVMVDPSGEIMRPSSEGRSWAWRSSNLVDWRTPTNECQAVVCSGRLELAPSPNRVHPLPRGVRYWGGTLIHATEGIPGYPALDFGARRGTRVLAVERGYIRENSSAQGGDAFYMRGASGVDYWYGHITPTVTRGQPVRVGQVVGRIAAHFKADHLHLGANANFGGRIVGPERAGTDRKTDPAWRLGVSIMREITRAPRVG